MAHIEVVGENSPYLDEVKRLWRNNRATLGFYPEGAFDERAQKGQILAVIESGGVVGYLLYYTTGKNIRVRLTHLCVDDACRGQGYARELLRELRKLTKSHQGIGLYCRRDFPAWAIWPRLGFVAISGKIGRSQDGHELTYFWAEYPQKTLFSATSEEDGLKAVIDANVFYDIDDPSRKGAEETQGLLADWLQPLIHICISGELFNEIQRNNNPEQRENRLSQARHYERLQSDTDGFLAANDAVRLLLGQPNSVRDESDQRHLAHTIASDASVFVTRDERILRIADEIYDRHGLSIVRPSQLVARFEELRNEREYQRARLAGTPLQVRRSNTDATVIAEFFQDQTSGERKRDLVDQLNVAFAHPGSFQCRIVESRDRKPLALYVTERVNQALLVIRTFRISQRVLQTRLAPTLTRTLLAGIVHDALRLGSAIVRMSEPALNNVVTTSLHSAGFFLAKDTWFKISISSPASRDAVSERIREAVTVADIDPSVANQLGEVLREPSFEEDTARVLAMEHTLWPCKFIGCDIPNYVIPIRPRWASQLFDSGLTKNFLWGVEAELALNPDSVYYRAVRPPLPTDQGRILWYVSEDKKFPGTKRIRASSQLTDVAVGQPKELFRRFRRFGVYEWQNVRETAGSLEGQLMALQFCDTELFSNPISWNSARSILQRHGIRSTFQSPTRICEESFLEIYRTGLGVNG